jgi:hypothetical protein
LAVPDFDRNSEKGSKEKGRGNARLDNCSVALSSVELVEALVSMLLRAWMVACVLYNRAELITDFEAIGYEVIDTWKALEHFVKIIGKPESSAFPYSGFFFRLKEQVPKRGGTDHDTTTGAKDGLARPARAGSIDAGTSR